MLRFVIFFTTTILTIFQDILVFVYDVNVILKSDMQGCVIMFYYYLHHYLQSMPEKQLNPQISFKIPFQITYFEIFSKFSFYIKFWLPVSISVCKCLFLVLVGCLHFDHLCLLQCLDFTGSSFTEAMFHISRYFLLWFNTIQSLQSLIICHWNFPKNIKKVKILIT